MSTVDIINNVGLILDKIKEATKLLPHDQQGNIFNQISTLEAALQQAKEDQQSTDPFRNRAHAALTWVVVCACGYDYILLSQISIILQLLHQKIDLPPVDSASLLTLVGLVLFGKAISGGYNLVDTIHKRISDLKSDVADDTNNNNPK